MLDLEKMTPEDFHIGGDPGKTQQGAAAAAAVKTGDEGKVGADAGKDSKNDEGKDNAGAAGGGAKTGEDAASAAASGAAAAQQQSATDDKDEQDRIAAFESLSQETGLTIRSDEDVVASLKELTELKKGNIPGLSPALKRAIEIEKGGGSIAEFFAALAFDPDKQPEKEVLRHRFLGKSETAKTNVKLAGMEFEREFDSRYGKYLAYQSIKDDAEKKEYYEKYSGEIDYQQERYNYDVAQAKTEAKDLKENFPIAAQQGMTQKEVDDLIAKHTAEATAAFADFKTVDVPIEGEEVFHIGLNSRTKPLVEKWIKEPQTFLDAIGVLPDRFDYKQLLNVMAVVAEFSDPEFGKRFKKQILDNKDVHTLENQLDGSGTVDRNQRASSTEVKQDDWEKVGQAAEDARKKHQQR